MKFISNQPLINILWNHYSDSIAMVTVLLWLQYGYWLQYSYWLQYCRNVFSFTSDNSENVFFYNHIDHQSDSTMVIQLLYM